MASLMFGSDCVGLNQPQRLGHAIAIGQIGFRAVGDVPLFDMGLRFTHRAAVTISGIKLSIVWAFRAKLHAPSVQREGLHSITPPVS